MSIFGEVRVDLVPNPGWGAVFRFALLFTVRMNRGGHNISCAKRLLLWHINRAEPLQKQIGHVDCSRGPNLSYLCSQLRGPGQQDLIGRKRVTQQEPPSSHLGVTLKPALNPMPIDSISYHPTMVNLCLNNKEEDHIFAARFTPFTKPKIF